MTLTMIWNTLPNDSNEYDPETDTILMMTRKTRPNNGRLMSAPYPAQAQGPPYNHHFLDIPHTLYFSTSNVVFFYSHIIFQPHTLNFIPHTLYFFYLTHCTFYLMLRDSALTSNFRQAE